MDFEEMSIPDLNAMYQHAERQWTFWYESNRDSPEITSIDDKRFEEYWSDIMRQCENELDGKAEELFGDPTEYPMGEDDLEDDIDSNDADDDGYIQRAIFQN